MTTASSKSRTARSKAWWLFALLGLAAAVSGSALPAFMLKEPAPKESPTTPLKNEDSSLTYVAPTWPEAPSAGALLARLAAGTVVVLVLCAGSLWFGKRWLLRGIPGTAPGNGNLKLIESLTLGSRCAVFLIQAGGRQVLIGVDASGMKSIVPLPESFDAALQNEQSSVLMDEMRQTTVSANAA